MTQPDWMDGYVNRKTDQLFDGLASTGVVVYGNDMAEVRRMMQELITTVMTEMAVHLSHPAPEEQQ